MQVPVRTSVQLLVCIGLTVVVALLGREPQQLRACVRQYG